MRAAGNDFHMLCEISVAAARKSLHAELAAAQDRGPLTATGSGAQATIVAGGRPVPLHLHDGPDGWLIDLAPDSKLERLAMESFGGLG